MTKDGRLIIEGEDFGDKDAALAQGSALSQLVRLWHSVEREMEHGIAAN